MFVCIEKAIPLLALYTTPVELMLSYLLYDVVPFAAFFCVVLVLGWATDLHKKDKKMSDEDGIRTHAGRAHWISSPTP